MAPSTPVDLLKAGIAAARAGNRPAARDHLLAAIRLKPEDELSWLWLSSVTADRAQAAWFLGRVLAINPDHQQARDWLRRLDQALGVPGPWRCPFCGRGSRQAEVRCPACRTLFAAPQIDAWCALPLADRALLRASVAFLECPPGRSERPSWHWMLGIAHLNLGNFTSALPHLRLACADAAGNAGNGTLGTLTDLLEVWLAEQAAGPRAAEPAAGSLTAGQGADPRTTARAVAPAAPAWQGNGSAPAGASLPAGPPAAPARQSASAPARNLVLVVDDSPTVRRLVAMAVEGHGYRTVLAADGVQALARLDETVPNLVLLDIAMPRLDGYRVCRLIKSNPRTRQVPVVMLSGRDGLFDRIRGRAAGADDYISKPVDRQTLLRALERWAPREAPN